MKLTLHEVAKVVGAKNSLSDIDDVPLRQAEFGRSDNNYK